MNIKASLKEHKTKHDWVAKGIDKELCKNLRSDYSIKWYMHKLGSLQENETINILWNFDIQTDHLHPG